MILLSLLLSATPEGRPDVELTWIEPTCADGAMQASAQRRSASICGGSPVTAAVVQSRTSSKVAGCEVWLDAWCADGPAVTYEPPGVVTVPTLYADRTFGGLALSLRPGEYALRDVPLPGLGDWNDKVSSLRVPAGFTVRLCHEPGGVGRCTDFVADAQDVETTYVGGDDAAWVQVVHGALPSLYSCPRVFENDGFKGKMLEVCQDVPDLRGGDWNDKVSSVIVPAGWALQLCANAEFAAPCKEVEGELSKLSGTVVGADTTTSMRIVRKP